MIAAGVLGMAAPRFFLATTLANIGVGGAYAALGTTALTGSPAVAFLAAALLPALLLGLVARPGRIAAPDRGSEGRRRQPSARGGAPRRNAAAQAIRSSPMSRLGSSMRGACPPRRMLLPSNRVRWSIGAGSSQCSSFISPFKP